MLLIEYSRSIKNMIAVSSGVFCDVKHPLIGGHRVTAKISV